MEVECLSPVGGFIERGELPEAAAKRELLEETGYESPDWTALGEFAVDAQPRRRGGRICSWRGVR